MNVATRLLVLFVLIPVSVLAATRASGYCAQGGQVVVTGAAHSTNKVQQSYPSCTITVLYSGGPQGFVSTSGTAVTFLSGSLFNANSGWTGLTITIAGTPFVIASVTSATSLTLTASAGTQTGVTYSMPASAPAPIFSDNAGTALANPFSSSSTGYWFFHANNANYDIKASGGGIPAPITWGNVPVIDPGTLPVYLSDTSIPFVYPALTNLCSAAATNHVPIVINYVQPVATGFTCNAPQITFNGGMIQPASGQKFTPTGTLSAPIAQIFDLSLGGTVDLSAAIFPELYPEWWGANKAGSTAVSNSTAINAALAQANNGATIHFTHVYSVLNVSKAWSARDRIKLIFDAGSKFACTNSDGSECAYLSSAVNPVDITIDGMVLRGGDGSSGDVGCATTNYGNGLHIGGGATFTVHIRNLTASGFCKSGSAGVWLDGPENSDWTGGNVGNADDYGLKLTNITSMSISNVTNTGSATYNTYIQDAALTVNNLASQSGMKTCIHAEGLISSTINNPYIENCNISGTSGKYGFELVSTSSSHLNISNTITSPIIHTNANTSGFYFASSGGGLTSGNTIIGGSASGAAAPIVIDTGGSANTFVNTPALSFAGAAISADTPTIETSISPYQILPRSAASTGSTNCTAPAYSFAGYLTTGMQSNGTSTVWLCAGGTAVGTLTNTTATFPGDVAPATIHTSGSATIGGNLTVTGGNVNFTGWDYELSSGNLIFFDTANSRSKLTVQPGSAGAGTMIYDGAISASGQFSSGGFGGATGTATNGGCVLTIKGGLITTIGGGC